jgi:hypothetical protein
MEFLMTIPVVLHPLRLLAVLFLLGMAATLPFTETVVAETAPRIQELQGFVENGHGRVYTLSNLKKGVTLSAYMTNSGGNLDPLLAIIKDGDTAAFTPEVLLDSLANGEHDLIKVFSLFAADKFLAWDDDGGIGYDARLTFQVPADGTYALFAGSMITNQSIYVFKPEFTSGSFRLLLGINAPEVVDGQGEPTGQPFATVDDIQRMRSVHVQRLDQQLNEEKKLNFHSVRNLLPGDTLYARLVSLNDLPLPQLILSDFGGKILAFGKEDDLSGGVNLTYLSREGADGLRLYVDGSTIDGISEEIAYHLDVSINVPEVMAGKAVVRGLPVFEESKNVQIALAVDQIVNVDQKNENFTVVGSLELTWHDPALAFSPDKCNCAIKKIGFNDLKALAVQNSILLPSFTFFNQQGNRWSQAQMVLIEPSGLATYQERFTVTLQAPEFDFRAYPFDRQQFNVRVDLALPTEVYVLEGIDQQGNALGDQLGEEEWSVVSYSQKVEAVPIDKNLEKSRFTMSMEVKRHLNFYIVRILIPLLLIIAVSWVIFFLKDYGRQLEVASGNLLVFVAFNFTISDDLPRLGYLTMLDVMIITSFCCAAIVVIISVCQKRFEAKGRVELAARIDNIVLLSYPLVYVTLIAIAYYIVRSRTA